MKRERERERERETERKHALALGSMIVDRAVIEHNLFVF